MSKFALVVCLIVPSGFLFSAVHEPLTFEENAGQSARDVRFVGRSNGGAVFLTDRDALIGLPGASLRLSLRGADAASRIEPLDLKPGRSNYFHGSDPRKWKTGVRRYGRVRYSGVYPGLDLVYYGAGDRLEYDFVVAPGASADRIEIEFVGARKLAIGAHGDLLIDTADWPNSTPTEIYFSVRSSALRILKPDLSPSDRMDRCMLWGRASMAGLPPTFN